MVMLVVMFLRLVNTLWKKNNNDDDGDGDDGCQVAHVGRHTLQQEQKW